MSSQQAGFGNAGKKAVHVKWAGKTIALGTFPAAEADEKCARAKALTRAWRSTMRPKPSREWVMLELERLGVRVVSGRLGRKAGEEGDDGPSPVDKKGMAGAVGGMGMGVGPIERSNSIGWGTDADFTQLMARRNSSLGLSMMNDGRRGSLSSLGQVVSLDSGDPTMPPHRPLVGGGAAAAFEAARHDHYSQKSAEQQRRASSLGLGSLAGGGLGNMGMSVNPNQHYEMLKLHHMNLLNEIQETTLMMNLYQQQQLQQQQQQLQQQANAELGGGDAQMAMMLQQNQNHSSLDQMFGSAQMGQQHRSSLGLGMGGGGFTPQQMQMLQQRDQMMQGGMGGGMGTSDVNQNQDLEGRLAQLKEEMARGQDSGVMNDNKRMAADGDERSPKRPKVEDGHGGDEHDDEDDDDEDDDDDSARNGDDSGDKV